MTEISQLLSQIEKLKTEKRILIGQYNKEKDIRESLEKEVKIFKKQSKRGGRKIKKSLLSQEVSIGTQTVQKVSNSISIQTDHVTSNETYYQCRKIVEDLVQKSLIKEQGIQCNFIEDQDPDEKNIMIRNSKMNDEFYLMKHYKNPKYNISRVAYINENYDMRFRREMLGVLDMDEDFRYINISGKLMHSLLFTFYSANRKLFDFNYKVVPNVYRNKKLVAKRDFLTISGDRKMFKKINKELIPLQDEYNLRITYEKQTRTKEYFRIINKLDISSERVKASKRYNKERLPKSMKKKLQKEVTDIITSDIWIYTFYLNGKNIFEYAFDTDSPIKIMQSNANFNFNFE